jgi:hypothetical protein
MTIDSAHKLMLLAGLGVGFVVRGDFFVSGQEAAERRPPPTSRTFSDTPRVATAARLPSRAPAPDPATRAVADERPAEAVDAGSSSALEEAAPTAGPVESNDRDDAAHAFAIAVLRMSAEADAIDRVWRTYGRDCQVSVGRSYDFGREWFAIWDQAVQPRVTSAECAALLQWLADKGEALRHDLAAAQNGARRARLPEETVEGMLRWHSLEWRP